MEHFYPNKKKKKKNLITEDLNQSVVQFLLMTERTVVLFQS